MRTLVGYGLRQEEIAELVYQANGEPISVDSLQRHFRTEINTGAGKANSKVAESLFKNAVERHNVTAQIFWLKTRAGWKETVVQEHTGKDGGPIVVDWSKLTDEQARLLEPILAALAGGASGAAGAGPGGDQTPRG